MFGKIKLVVVGFAFLSCLSGASLNQELNAVNKEPEIARFIPGTVSVSTMLDIEGFRLIPVDSGLEKTEVHFVQGAFHKIVRPNGSVRFINDPLSALQNIHAEVPEGLMLGSCQIIVEANKLRSPPMSIEITERIPPELTVIRPPWVKPGEVVWLDGTGFHTSDDILLIDANGDRHQLKPDHSPRYLAREIPRDLPEGEATLSIVNRHNPNDLPSSNLKFLVSSGPLPLEVWPDWLVQVAPGQWLKLILTSLKPLEDAEKAEVMFKQGKQTIVTPIINHAHPRVRIPSSLLPGEVYLQTRTMRNAIFSFWSEPVLYRLQSKPVAPIVDFIQLGEKDNPTYIWLTEGPARPSTFIAKPGDTVILCGTFPVPSVERLQVMLEFNGGIRQLVPIADSNPSLIKIEVPQGIQIGDWRLSIRSPDEGVQVKLPIAMHVE